MKKTFKIDISIETLEKRLKKILTLAKESNSELIAKSIINNLYKSEVGLRQLFLSFLGIEETVAFIPGDKVIVTVDRLGTWRWDKPRMNKELIVDGKIKGIVRSTDMYKANSVEIVYSYYKEAEANLQEESTWLSEIDVTLDVQGLAARTDISDLL